MEINGWQSSRLRELPLDFIDGDRSSKYPNKAEFQRSGFLFLNTSNIVNNRLVLGDANFVSQEKYSEITKARLQPNDE
jgi:type I restriction enzyme, S subunit